MTRIYITKLCRYEIMKYLENDTADCQRLIRLGRRQKKGLPYLEITNLWQWSILNSYSQNINCALNSPNRKDLIYLFVVSLCGGRPWYFIDELLTVTILEMFVVKSTIFSSDKNTSLNKILKLTNRNISSTWQIQCTLLKKWVWTIHLVIELPF